MEVLLVTVFVCVTLWISNVIFSRQEQKRKKNIVRKNKMLQDFYTQDLANMEEVQLSGISIDMNSDMKFSEAVNRINLSIDVGVQLYD